MATRWVVVLLVGWMAGLALGLVFVIDWETTPGSVLATPPEWPEESSLVRSPDRATVVMFAHPRCSCTRASLAELMTVMRDNGHDAIAIVAFLEPDGRDDTFVEGTSWDRAAEIPRTQRVIDRGGLEAKRFGATTSGHVVIYDGAGRRLFSGGITGSRGHVGDNYGRRSILARLLHREGESRYDVFGCPMEGS